MIWELQGTDQQKAIVQEAIRRCNFPFEVMQPQLRSEVNREAIPVEWADLSRWGGTAMRHFGGQHDRHDHEHDQEHEANWSHVHTEGAHGVAFRERVLGLAWYSGKVSLDISMESNPALAMEVFLAEGAHMVDFFFMENRHRVAVWNALHHSDSSAQLSPDTNITDGLDLGHGHSWFDVGGYYSWVGEAWMGLFIKAYSDLPVTIPFDHPPDYEAVHVAQHAFTPYFGSNPKYVPAKVYHDHHKGRPKHEWFVSAEHARSKGRQPCRVCKPGA